MTDLEAKIENIIDESMKISNAELMSVLEDENSLIFLFNDYLRKEDEMIRDLKGHFSGFKKAKFDIHEDESPIIVEIAVPKTEL